MTKKNPSFETRLVYKEMCGMDIELLYADLGRIPTFGNDVVLKNCYADLLDAAFELGSRAILKRHGL